MQLCTGGGVCVCGGDRRAGRDAVCVGGMEATCGAVSGAVMLAGFKNSCADPKNPKTKAATYQLTREITRQFAERNHALVCKELKGLETGVVLRSCPDCIRDAVAIAEKVLQ